MYTSPKILASLDANAVLAEAYGSPCAQGSVCIG